MNINNPRIDTQSIISIIEKINKDFNSIVNIFNTQLVPIFADNYKIPEAYESLKTQSDIIKQDILTINNNIKKINDYVCNNVITSYTELEKRITNNFENFDIKIENLLNNIENN